MQEMHVVVMDIHPLPLFPLCLSSYRGDIVNGLEFTPAARANDPYRMLSAYHQSAQVSTQCKAICGGVVVGINFLSLRTLAVEFGCMENRMLWC